MQLKCKSREISNKYVLFQIQKVYYAKVANKVLAQSQIVSAPLGPDPLHPMIQVNSLFSFFPSELFSYSFLLFIYC